MGREEINRVRREETRRSRVSSSIREQILSIQHCGETGSGHSPRSHVPPPNPGPAHVCVCAPRINVPGTMLPPLHAGKASILHSVLVPFCSVFRTLVPTY